MALTLAKAGMWGGDPDKVMQASTDMVVTAIAYLKFAGECERAYIELNKEKP